MLLYFTVSTALETNRQDMPFHRHSQDAGHGPWHHYAREGACAASYVGRGMEGGEERDYEKRANYAPKKWRHQRNCSRLESSQSRFAIASAFRHS